MILPLQHISTIKSETLSAILKQQICCLRPLNRDCNYRQLTQTDDCGHHLTCLYRHIFRYYWHLPREEQLRAASIVYVNLLKAVVEPYPFPLRITIYLVKNCYQHNIWCHQDIKNVLIHNNLN